MNLIEIFYFTSNKAVRQRNYPIFSFTNYNIVKYLPDSMGHLNILLVSHHKLNVQDLKCRVLIIFQLMYSISNF
jgi:hypothetical protein